MLYTMPQSVYLGMEGVDCWDEERDARSWPGGTPVVAHPPCRLWGRLRRLSTAPIAEKDLARHAVSEIRRWGGVLEHPAGSLLWADQGLPTPDRGSRGEFTIAAPQRWWGHRCEKWTWFFVAGLKIEDIPPIPLRLGYPTHVVTSSKKIRNRELKNRSERSATPPLLAEWLVAIARLVPQDFYPHTQE